MTEKEKLYQILEELAKGLAEAPGDVVFPQESAVNLGAVLFNVVEELKVLDFEGDPEAEDSEISIVVPEDTVWH